MTVVFNEDFAGLAVGASVTGRTIPGTSYVWTGGTGSQGMFGATGGGIISSSPATNNNLGFNSSQLLPSGELILSIDPTTGPMDSMAFWLAPNIASKESNSIEIAPDRSFGSVSMRRRGGPDPKLFRNVEGLTFPTGAQKIALYVDKPTKVVRFRVLDMSDAVLIEVVGTLPDSLLDSASTWMYGYYFASAPIETAIRRVVYDNLASGSPAPSYTDTGSEKTGRVTANITFTSDQAGGEAFYLTKENSVTPTTAEMLAATYKTGIVVGPNVISVTGLTPDTTYYAFVMPRGAGKDVGTVSAAGNFKTDAPLAPPGGSSSVSVIGDKVTVTYAPAGPVSSATCSIPVAATPNGAVAQGPVPMTFSGENWVAIFSAVPGGNYSNPVVLATNADHPLVSITGASSLSIIPLKGFDIPSTEEIPTLPLLTNPQLLSDAPGTLSAVVTVEAENTGTLYVVVTDSATKPSGPQVKSGFAADGSPAPWVKSAAVTAIGTITIKDSHSLGDGLWYAHFMQESGEGVQSAVVTSNVYSIGPVTNLEPMLITGGLKAWKKHAYLMMT